MYRLIANAQLAIIPGGHGGHVSFLNQPKTEELVAESLRKSDLEIVSKKLLLK